MAARFAEVGGAGGPAQGHLFTGGGTGKWQVWLLLLGDPYLAKLVFLYQSILFILFHKPFGVLYFTENAFFRRGVGHRKDGHNIQNCEAVCFRTG